MSTAPDRRLLLVHAHPDDESINNGATMAKYAAEGARVTLITCTLGEEGEVIPSELAHLAPHAEAESRPAPGSAASLTPLARHRMAELAAAVRELGVTDHRLLGGPGRYRDSGMMGGPTNERPESFWQAPVDDAAADLVQVIREVRPQVVVTYDPDGGYGHPDHIQAHRVAMRAVELAADPRRGSGEPHTVQRVYWNCVPLSALEPGFARLREEAGTSAARFPGVAEPADVPGLVADEAVVDVRIDGTAYAKAKSAAMGAHETQVAVDGEFFALSNGLGQPLLATEYYRCAEGRQPPEAASGAGRVVNDLFAEVDV